MKNPRENEKRKKNASNINYYAVKYILKYLNPKTHFIFFSTDKVYSPNIKFAKENSKCNPITLYGKLKLKSEKIKKKIGDFIQFLGFLSYMVLEKKMKVSSIIFY